MNTIIFLALGGFFGAIIRFYIGNLAKNKLKTVFPWGTFAINLIGSFLLGYLLGSSPDVGVMMFFGVGFSGALTTFSTFNVEVLQLLLGKKRSVSVIYLLASYFIGVVLALLGYLIGIK